MTRFRPGFDVARLAAWTLLASLAAAPATAAVFVVTSADDWNDENLADGLCRDFFQKCTLRAAIQQANALSGLDRVEFSLPSLPATPTIELSSSLSISEELVIDGYTQHGASANTLAVGTNADIEVTIDGSHSGSPEAISVWAPNVVLRGLAIRNIGIGIWVDGSLKDPRFSKIIGNRIESCGTGVLLTDASAVRVGFRDVGDRNLIVDNNIGIDVRSSGNFILNNLIGTDGTTRRPNIYSGIQLGGDANSVSDNLISGNTEGVLITGSDNTLIRNRIGTTADGQTALPNDVGINVQGAPTGAHNRIGVPKLAMADANLISGNGKGLVLAPPGGGNLVQGNYFGTGAGGVGTVPNTIAAIEIFFSDDNVIGAPADVIPTLEGNVIAHNTGYGIHIPYNPSFPFAGPNHNTIRANRIFDNPFDIDLGGLPTSAPQNGMIDDDFGDFDFGPNGLQNPPRIQSAFIVLPDETRITGVIDAMAGDYVLDFYSNPGCDALPDTGRGETYLGTRSITAAPTPSARLTPFDVTLPVQAPGQGFSAIATSRSGDSSELGPCFRASLGGEADLGLEVSLSSETFDPEDPIDVKVTVHNAGPQAATNVPVRIPRPAAIASWSATPSQGSFDTTSDTWSVGNLPSGGSATLELAGSIDADATGSASIEASADQNLAERDPDLSNNRVQSGFAVRAGADLVVIQSPETQSGVPEEPANSVAFDVTVLNLGPATSRGVIASGNFAAGLELDTSVSLVEIVPTQNGWTRALGDIEPGDSVTIHIPALISASVQMPSGLTHTVVASSAQDDDSTPAIASAVVGVPTVTDLRVEAHASRLSTSDLDPQVPRKLNAFSVSIFNDGPDLYFPSYTLRVEVCEDPGHNCSAEAECRWLCTDTTNLELEMDSDQASFEILTDGTFDPDPTNNRVTAMMNISGVVVGCGLLGIEASMALGLYALVRGKRGRRALRRLYGRGAALFLLAVATAVAPDSARAASITLSVDSAASSATMSLVTPLGSPTAVPVTLSGSVDADVGIATGAPFGPYAASLHFTGGDIALSDASILMEDSPLFSLTFASQGLGATLSGPTVTGFGVAPGLSLFDVFGSSLRFDAGSVGATGDYFGLPVDQALDLVAFPFTSTFPLNSVVQARVVDLGGGQASVALRVPFSAPFRISMDDTDNTVTIAGTLELRGQMAVPEPAVAPLVAAGLVGLGIARRWRRFGSQRRR